MTKPKVKPITESEYARLKKRADELVGCIENSPEELEDIADQLDVYEATQAQTLLDEVLTNLRAAQ